MSHKKILPLALLLAMLPAGRALADAAATAAPLVADPQSVIAPPPPLAESGNCSAGFLSRMAAAYREDAHPADPNAPAPKRRAMDAPFDSPPFPNSEWQMGGVPAPIGVPDTNSTYP
ncbi:MAG TPA: hypothetical protein VN731_10980, partial [Rhodanobacter sp.]|nr:hypothetical protein [Rhodanobacter sp.]